VVAVRPELVPEPSAPEATLRTILRRALGGAGVEEVARDVAALAQTVLGAASAQVVLLEDGDGLRSCGQGPSVALPPLPGVAQVLALRAGLVTRRDLGEGEEPLGALLDRTTADALIPLRHLDRTVGAVVLASPRSPPPPELAQLAVRAARALATARLYLLLQGQAGTRHQVSLAQAVQDALLPDSRAVRRGLLTLRGLSRPATECGGDFWTWEDLGEDRLLLAIGDVTGKGVAAAMLCAIARGVAGAMRSARGPALDPAELLRALNGAIFHAARTRWMMTSFALVIECTSGNLTCANAGHHFPYVIRQGGLQPMVVRGNALGAAADASFATVSRVLEAGDSLLLYTDGLVDATAPGGEPFGDKRLRRLLEAAARAHLAPAALPELLLGELERHAVGRLPDDVTLIELARPAKGAP
jgi:serine phosphatase RsbU (regulator of sigma subunit)